MTNNLGETSDRLWTQKARVEERVVTDGAEQVVFFVSVERRLSNHHLVEQNAERPPVH